ncbi:heparinase II/III family protein [Sphingosinicella rhizophila]|uniref:Heparinase II/III family protein n=1 Tax=Sphingosinicella rhizophila TaxID=3050082 RepID=A0ABU3Q917_9SPHN|nr:heparinase II/III family protein [Sphingosinicella sp. GR2756]MDT9599599.1 heparinase II/III family protein [Sphingosinicella sp. GR2756]
MSLLEKIDSDPPEEIESGKRLIRVGDDRGASLSERLAYQLHRLAWRTPFHSFRLRGRFPLKLLAVPKDPIAGDKAAGEAILAGQLVRAGHKISIEALDFTAAAAMPRAMADYLQSFAWLRDLAAAATRERGARMGEKITQKWLLAHFEHVSEPAWRADLWGRRILFWSAYAPYILSSRDMVYRSAVLNTLARGARHLDKGAEKAPPGLARITAWSGVITAALVVQGGPARLGKGETGLIRALGTALHEDGGLVSRSPIEQLALVELLGQLRAVYYSARREMPEAIAEALEDSVAALLAVTLGDDCLSSWQGGNMVSRRRLEAAVEGSGVRARALRQARGWGYQRLAAKNSVVVFDAAPPPSSRALSGGCASTLAFELSDGPNRIVTNCGGVGETPDALSPALIKGLRTTAAHSTLTLGDRNSTAIHEDGTLGKGVSQVELGHDETGGVINVEATHDGYVRRYGLLHQRQLTLSGDGLELRGQDSLVPQGRRRRTEPVPFSVRFHLAPAVEVAATADGQGALLRVRGSGAWQFRCRGGKLSIEDGLWIDGDAKPHASQQLIISGETPPDGMTIAWLLRRAG